MAKQFTRIDENKIRVRKTTVIPPVPQRDIVEENDFERASVELTIADLKKRRSLDARSFQKALTKLDNEIADWEEVLAELDKPFVSGP